jgi:hypothetical protein
MGESSHDVAFSGSIRESLPDIGWYTKDPLPSEPSQ